jgi:hypothetical protein
MRTKVPAFDHADSSCARDLQVRKQQSTLCITRSMCCLGAVVPLLGNLIVEKKKTMLEVSQFGVAFDFPWHGISVKRGAIIAPISYKGTTT